MPDQFMEDYKRDTVEGLIKENERLRRALRSAKSDLVQAIKEIDRELTIHLAVSNGEL